MSKMSLFVARDRWWEIMPKFYQNLCFDYRSVMWKFQARSKLAFDLNHGDKTVLTRMHETENSQTLQYHKNVCLVLKQMKIDFLLRPTPLFFHSPFTQGIYGKVKMQPQSLDIYLRKKLGSGTSYVYFKLVQSSSSHFLKSTPRIFSGLFSNQCNSKTLFSFFLP